MTLLFQQPIQVEGSTFEGVASQRNDFFNAFRPFILNLLTPGTRGGQTDRQETDRRTD